MTWDDFVINYVLQSTSNYDSLDNWNAFVEQRRGWSNIFLSTIGIILHFHRSPPITQTNNLPSNSNNFWTRFVVQSTSHYVSLDNQIIFVSRRRRLSPILIYIGSPLKQTNKQTKEDIHYIVIQSILYSRA